MSSILQKIVSQKRKEVRDCLAEMPLNQLLKDNRLDRETYSMKSALINSSGIIAEFKRASPSKGILREEADVKAITTGYEQAGASAISVLADREFFKANINDLPYARQGVGIPILRKEFIVDEYQIYQSKIVGADCVLLIAAILSRKELSRFIEIAMNIGLEAIIEVHNERELDKLSGKEQLVGVNNRNLETFEVSVETSIDLAGRLGSVTKISESGLGENTDFSALHKAGYQGFLVGESFMTSADPAIACKSFVELVNRAKK